MISRGVLPQSDRVADLLTRLTLRAPGETIRALERWTLPELVKARLLNALAQSGDYQALPVITKAVGDRSIMVRAAAVDALGALQHPDCENALRSALQDESWEVRMRAATAIGAADLPDLSDALLVASEDAIWLVRSEAAKALLSMSDHGVEKLRALASDLRRTAPGRSLGPDPKAAVA
jgi:HEAT repeat protein